MAYEPRNGDGALFGNKDRTKDTQPNATGYIVAHRDIKEGERLRLAAWTKDGSKGKFQSLKMSDDQKRDEAQQEQSQGGPDLDDAVPFAPQVD